MRKYNIRTDALQTTIMAASAQEALQAILAQEAIAQDQIDGGGYVVATADDGTDSASVGTPS